MPKVLADGFSSSVSFGLGKLGDKQVPERMGMVVGNFSIKETLFGRFCGPSWSWTRRQAQLHLYCGS